MTFSNAKASFKSNKGPVISHKRSCMLMAFELLPPLIFKEPVQSVITITERHV